MVKRFLVPCTILLIGLLPLAAQNGKINEKVPKEKTENLITLPTLIPGFDQIKNRKYLKGSLLLGSFAAGLAGTLIYNGRGYNKFEKYQLSFDIPEIIKLRKETESTFTKRNLFLIGTFSIWIIHLIDIKIFNKRSKIKSEVNQNSIGFGIYFYF